MPVPYSNLIMRKLIIFVAFLSISANLYADTIIMRNKTRLKGLVVDEYKDRVTISSIDGEKDIFSKDIERIEYDTPEQNFMQLGRMHELKGWNEKASFYYKKAMELNPEYKDAREAYLASHAKLWREEEERAKKEIERHTRALEWWKNRNIKPSVGSIDKVDSLKKVLGISLLEKDGSFIVEDVLVDSNAERAGIAKGDFLVGVWGKLIRHSRKEDIVNELLGPPYSEIRALIEKEIHVPREAGTKNLYKKLGIVLGFEYEGLVVKDVLPGKTGDLAGFKKGDFIIAVDRNITRYLPLDNVIALINSAKDNDVIFTIRRNITLMRGGG